MRGCLTLLTASLICGIMMNAQTAQAFDMLTSENQDVVDGNKLLASGKPAEALEDYDEAARSLPNRNAVHLNRGLALVQMGDEQIDQAMQAFKLASEGDGTDKVRARALFNLGNTFFKKEDYEEAIRTYQKSLMLVPGNKDVAWNLELAKQKQQEKKEQQEKQDQENKDQQNQDQQNQDQQNQDQQNQDQDKKDQDKKDQDKKDQDKKDQDKKDPQEQQEKKQPQPEQQPKTKQEVEQVLDSLDNQQQNLQKQMARQKGAMVPQGQFKDW